ncbi:hypothetical protein Hypma_006698 [Hypsizygus marmoreus]|uniref:Uncharacterized protein n=1 Tax=Hypsizygus marmoreus TaxID=39966 RepID=A0A369K1C2_HYPMA|nr:hypothetical protein Hypma_006698 [Hypsizygus marmoreus]
MSKPPSGTLGDLIRALDVAQDNHLVIDESIFRQSLKDVQTRVAGLEEKCAQLLRCHAEALELVNQLLGPRRGEQCDSTSSV